MSRLNQLSVVSLLLAAGTSALSGPPASSVPQSLSLAPDSLSHIAAALIADAIPRVYERSEDWGRTTQIVTGLRSSGNFFKFDIHRKRSQVRDGVWRKYQVTVIEPDKNLDVRIENLRSIGTGQLALTLRISARLHGWARAVVYERGIHIISLEAEGDATVRLRLDAQIAIERITSKYYLPGIAVRPHVNDARLKLDDFQLTRISDLRGPVARELGEGLRRLIEDQISGPRLAEKINRSLEKRRDRLEVTPDKLIGVATSDRAVKDAKQNR